MFGSGGRVVGLVGGGGGGGGSGWIRTKNLSFCEN